MRPMKHGFSNSITDFLKDSTGHFNLGTVIAIAAFVMLCRIVEKDKKVDPWVVSPFTIIVVGYFAIDTQITRVVARATSGIPDTVVNTDTTNLDSETTTVSPTQTPTTTTD